MKKLTSILLMCTMVFALTACGGKKNGTLSYDLPEGFTEQATGQYVSPDYANGDYSSIVVQAFEDDPYGVNYKEDEIEELISMMYEVQGYSVTSFNLNEFTKGKMGGYETLLFECEYVLEGISFLQIEFLAQIGNVTHVIAYTTAPQFGWYDAFRDSIDTIEIK